MMLTVEAQDDGTVEVFDAAGGCWGLTVEQARQTAALCDHALFDGRSLDVGNLGPHVLRVERGDLRGLAVALRKAAGRAAQP